MAYLSNNYDPRDNPNELLKGFLGMLMGQPGPERGGSSVPPEPIPSFEGAGPLPDISPRTVGPPDSREAAREIGARTAYGEGGSATLTGGTGLGGTLGPEQIAKMPHYGGAETTPRARPVEEGIRDVTSQFQRLLQQRQTATSQGMVDAIDKELNSLFERGKQLGTLRPLEQPGAAEQVAEAGGTTPGGGRAYVDYDKQGNPIVKVAPPIAPAQGVPGRSFAQFLEEEKAKGGTQEEINARARKRFAEFGGERAGAAAAGGAAAKASSLPWSQNPLTKGTRVLNKLTGEDVSSLMTPAEVNQAPSDFTKVTDKQHEGYQRLLSLRKSYLDAAERTIQHLATRPQDTWANAIDIWGKRLLGTSEEAADIDFTNSHAMRITREITGSARQAIQLVAQELKAAGVDGRTAANVFRRRANNILQMLDTAIKAQRGDVTEAEAGLGQMVGGPAGGGGAINIRSIKRVNP